MNSDVAEVLSGRRRWAVIEGDGPALLATLPEACCVVVTDPPYDEKTHAGTRTRSRALTERAKGQGPGRIVARDAVGGVGYEPSSVLGGIVSACLAASASWVVAFCSLEMLGGYQRAAGKRWVRAGVWHRPDSAPQFTGDRPAQGCEGIAIMHRTGHGMEWNGGGSRGFWSCPTARDRQHPQQKPAALMRALVEAFSAPGDLIVDPFAGSGTTGVAALSLGRRFLGIEMDSRWIAVAEGRLREADKTMPLFDMGGFGQQLSLNAGSDR